VQKKLTITLDEQDLEIAYCQMAADEEREAKALQWAEATCADALLVDTPGWTTS
jgi:hypothetical protein